MIENFDFKHQKVKTLLDAIPYIKKFFGKVIVIKYGGSAQTSPDLKEKFTQLGLQDLLYQ
jgi:acetylglutamate kinase